TAEPGAPLRGTSSALQLQHASYRCIFVMRSGTSAARFLLRGRKLAMQLVRSWRSYRSVRLCLPLVLLSAALFSQPVRAATQTITDADKGSTVHLKAGDRLEVRLKSNPTTGFMWYLKKESTRLLKLTGQSETKPPEPADGQPVVVGQPIVQVFEFLAK